jgi:hypothetical protein
VLVEERRHEPTYTRIVIDDQDARSEVHIVHDGVHSVRLPAAHAEDVSAFLQDSRSQPATDRYIYEIASTSAGNGSGRI